MERNMPLVKVNVLRGRSEEDINLLLDVIHEVVVETFHVPPRDLYQLLTEFDAAHFRALDTGLDISRTEKLVLLEITSRGRSRISKVEFYSNLTRALCVRCNVQPSDVIVSLLENSDEDWSFGLGRAQFLTGELV
jgi:phenylpyruvate tautomerase PptA (4-oxalocrotonate tautomerase family)